MKTIHCMLYITPVVSEMGSISISSYKGHEEVPILTSYIEHSDNIRRQKQKMFPKHCSCCVVRQNEGQYPNSLKYQESIVTCHSGYSRKWLLAWQPLCHKQQAHTALIRYRERERESFSFHLQVASYVPFRHLSVLISWNVTELWITLCMLNIL